MDKTVHWNPELRKNQEELLASLPEDRRKFAAFMIRTGNVAVHYYSERSAEPTLEDYEDWLVGLPEQLATFHRANGYEKSKGVLGLRRHAAERNDVGLNAYMKDALSQEDYEKWKESADKLN